MKFRSIALVAASLAVGITSFVAHAADPYPSKPITMIVPFAAGGPTDTVARTVGAVMSKSLGQQVIIENVSGAGGTIGVSRAVAAPADGHTILFVFDLKLSFL